MERLRTLAACVTLLVLSSCVLLASPASAAPLTATPNINGAWQCCGAGGAGVQTLVINGTGGEGLSTPQGPVFATLDVTQHGRKVKIVTTYTSFDVGYVGTFYAKVSRSGTTMTGTWKSNANQAGTFTMTLIGAASIHQTPLAYQHNVMPIAATLGTPGEVFHSMGHNVVNAVITVGVILFITFPANIFNQTFSSHYEEIIVMWKRSRRRLRRRLHLRDHADDEPVGSPTQNPTPGKAAWPVFAMVLVIGALLGGLLNPAFGINAHSVAGLAATLASFAFGAFVSWIVGRAFRRHHQYATTTYRQALPLGLAIGALCVLVSRLSSFQPGYLYGIIVSFSFIESLKERHKAHLTAIATLSSLAIALLAWFLWIPINHLTLSHGGNLALVSIDDMFGSIFVGGLVGTVVSLLPIETMPGKTLSAWRKDAWAVIFFIAIFLLVEVELRPESGPTHPGNAPLITAVVLFVVFGGATFAMRRYFSRREVHAVPASAPGAVIESPSESVDAGPTQE